MLDDVARLRMALAVTRDDALARLALADALEEAGEAGAALAQRWMAKKGMAPFHSHGVNVVRSESSSWIKLEEAWLWYGPLRKPAGPYCLPKALWYYLPGSEHCTVSREAYAYLTREDAEADLEYSAEMALKNGVRPHEMMRTLRDQELVDWLLK